MKRALFENIWKRMDDKKHIILTGPRQVGKTFLLKQLYKAASTWYKNTFYLNLEQPQYLNMLNENPENLYKFVTKPPEFVKDSSEKYYVFIDEIQYLKNPTNFLKYNYDFYEDTVKLIVTGSSAFYIDKKFKDSLAGRKRLFEMLSMSFEEFLHFKEYDDLIPDLHKLQSTKSTDSLNYKKIKVLMDEYICYGGYPEVVLAKDVEEKKSILFELTHTFVKRDLIESGIAADEVMFNLLSALGSNTGSLMNANSYANMLKVSPHTIENYIYILRKCFHIHLLPPYFANIGKSIRKMHKCYFNDLGFRNSLAGDFRNISERQDKGELLENFVYRRFRDIHDQYKIFFWRTSDGNEIDFILEDRYQTGNAYEVKFNGNMFNKNKYKLFFNKFKEFNFNCISYNGESSTLDSAVV